MMLINKISIREKVDIAVYPNPAADKITFCCNNQSEEFYQIDIVGMNGRQVLLLLPETKIGRGLLENENTLNNLNMNEYMVYPNPVSDILSILVNLASEEKFNFELSDMSGRLVSTLIRNETLTVGNTTRSFDISGLTPGMYIYRIIGHSFNKSGKITKN